MLINFRKKGHSGIIPFGHEGKEEKQKYMQHEVFMTVCMGRIAKIIIKKDPQDLC